jgi:hypothetical protein
MVVAIEGGPHVPPPMTHVPLSQQPEPMHRVVLGSGVGSGHTGVPPQPPMQSCPLNRHGLGWQSIPATHEQQLPAPSQVRPAAQGVPIGALLVGVQVLPGHVVVPSRQAFPPGLQACPGTQVPASAPGSTQVPIPSQVAMPKPRQGVPAGALLVNMHATGPTGVLQRFSPRRQRGPSTKHEVIGSVQRGTHMPALSHTRPTAQAV